MKIKSTLRKAAELGIMLTALTSLILVGCGGGGSASGGTATPGASTSAIITPYKGPFAQGATVTIKDANGNPVTLLAGGTVGANGVISVTYNQNVTYPLLVSVTGRYYNEVTRQMETTTVPLRGLITNAAGATNVPVTIITETAVALLMNQTGPISAANPIQAASAVAALGSAGTMYGIPASTVPSFNAATDTASDSNTILLSALSLVANSQAGTTLADKVVALANSLASLNAASAPSDVISNAALNNAIIAMTNGASSVAASGVLAPTATISTAPLVTAPGAPTAVTALGGNTTAAISFTPPTNNGGAAITGYTVISTPGNITASGTTSPISVTGLTNGTAYTFTVTATNSAGSGTASNASNSVTPSANSSASGAATAVGSYIADHLTPGFVGFWAITPAWVVPASAVVAAESNLVATGATTYNNTYVEKLLSGATWGPNPNPWFVGACYDLIPTGWLQCPSTGAWVDSGDGSTISITNTGEPALAVTMTSTSMAGTPITCTSPTTGLVVPCSVPGNYPAGAVTYTQTFGSDWYSLCGGSSGCTAITDSSGAPLTTLPTIGATGPTFCDTDNFIVLQPINPAPAPGSNNYEMFGTVSCLASDIASAIAAPAAGSVLVSLQNTGNSVVPTVLRMSAIGALAWMNNYIYGVRAGNVWYGWMTPNGTVGGVEENKIAINAELVANGLPPLP